MGRIRYGLWRIRMFPGMRGMNPKQMEAMMRKMGIKTESVDATKVIIYMPKKKIVIKGPDVTIMTVQGEDTFQITGREVKTLKRKRKSKAKKKTVDKTKKEEAEVQEGEPKAETEEDLTDKEEGPSGPMYEEEDVKLVVDQTGCTEEEARKALEESQGQPAEAILRLMSE